MKSKFSFVLGSYVKCRLKQMAAFVLFGIIFTIVYALYHLPLEPIAYSIELVAVLGLILGCMDFYGFYGRHQRLVLLSDSIATNSHQLPYPKNLLEQDYQNLIIGLADKQADLIFNFDNKRTEMLDYYTLWAHQIKTPISAMGLLLQTEAGSSQQTKGYQQELFKIEQYVEMVLQYLRLESMSADLILKEYDLLDAVRQAVKKYSMIFINKKITLDLEEMECQVITDEKWLVFVLEQIISNALKYTHQGKITIYMDAKKPKTLIIEDTGVGIRGEDIQRIFDRGFTGYNGRMDKKSTGIGLYLCKQVLNKLSHAITVTSILGAGTKVSIDLSAREFEAL
ncbi:sensor histidine kinase [Acetobacterium bakii]|uniref:histidine kinase n=1 Tax=Acetobacterium bakii TaxID=52689 RepID=A0A0L6TZZ5_9FIRM|nr:sensor histidine kinase [Acetobacterium bakii]KNZ41145.1 membrane protein [Acetobacterium bakii]